MAAYVRGDDRAFRALFDRYAPALYALVRRRLPSAVDAQDVVQHALLHLHRARRDFRTDSRVRPWLFTIAMNLVREHYRRRGRRGEIGLEPNLAARTPSDPGAALEQRERAARLRAALAQLPDPQREVIELHFFGELRYEEIARIVGAKTGAVRVRAHRGYRRLRQALEAQL